jgi:cbb3-type cytochrome oxidase subunit 1
LAFLAFASILLAFSASRLVFPDGLSSIGALAYGRLLPVALDLLLYGWLTVGLIGAGYFILPRLAGRALRHEGSAVLGAGLLTIGYVGGAVAVALGYNAGGQYLEFPLWADAVVLVGLLLVARVFVGTITGRPREELTASEWYLGSAPVWLLLAHVVGNVPGTSGVNETLQATFYRGSLFGLWFVAAGIGIVYYLVGAVTGGPARRPTQLTVAGFWSLPFVFALSAGARLTYTAAPDWHETIGGLFSISLFLPVAIILVDLAIALRGPRSGPADGTTLRFLVAGTVAFALYPVVNLALSLRSSSAIVGMTDWAAALDLLVVAGAFTLWLLAYSRHASAYLGMGGSGPGSAHFAFSVLAVSVAVSEMLTNGLRTGLGWVSAANSLQVAAGSGFEPTSGALDGQRWVRFAAFGLFALTQLVYYLASFREREPVPEDAAEHEDVDIAGGDSGEAGVPGDHLGGLPPGVPIGVGRLRTGTVGVFAMVLVFGFVFPALESDHGEATLLADTRRAYPAGSTLEQGRDIYVAEGCWYCHTQEVRGIVTDVGLGPVSRPGDYSGESPTVTGVLRVGPDLMFVGSRAAPASYDFDGSGETDPAEILAYIRDFLQDPRSVPDRAWATMPAHDYLTADDMDALAMYVASLRVHEFE